MNQHSGIIGPTINMIKNTAMKAIEGTEHLLGIDPSLNESPKEIIKDIEQIIENPETKKELDRIIKDIGEEATVIVDAAAPAVEEAVNKTIDIAEKSASKIGKSGVKLVLDVAGTIPIVGEVVEGVRVFDDIVKASQAGIDAGVKMVETGADVITQTTENMHKLSSVKNATENRVKESITNFKNTNIVPQQGGKLNPKTKINPKTKRLKMKKSMKRGILKNKNKSNKSNKIQNKKTKRVHFRL
jgi:hypothetical protein